MKKLLPLFIIPILFLPAFAEQVTISQPETQVCDSTENYFLSVYDASTQTFDCNKVILSDTENSISADDKPNSISCDSGYFVSSFDNETDNFVCSKMINSETSIITTSKIIPSEFDYIVFNNSTGTYSQNTITGETDYYGNDSASVIKDTALSKFPKVTTIFVKSGTYNLNSSLEGWNNFYLQGAGIDQTVFIRNFNATHQHTIGLTANYNFVDGNAVLKDFTINGNYPNVDNVQDEIALTGRGEISNVKIHNFNAIGIQAAGKILMQNVIIEGVGSATKGSTMGIWTTPESDVILTNSQISNMMIPAVFSQGTILISDSIFENNHLQTAPTGGGHIAVGNDAIIKGNVIRGGNSVTSGIETNQGNYIITENIISGLRNGVVTNGQLSNVIVSNNIILDTANPINQHGESVFYTSNNAMD